jgi:hypothetical protein
MGAGRKMDRLQPFAHLARTALLLRAESELSKLPNPGRLPDRPKDFEKNAAIKTQ